MPVVTRDQIIIVAASKLTAALLAKHDNIILPLVGNNTQVYLLELAATFHKLLPPETEPADINPFITQQ